LKSAEELSVRGRGWVKFLLGYTALVVVLGIVASQTTSSEVAYLMAWGMTLPVSLVLVPLLYFGAFGLASLWHLNFDLHYLYPVTLGLSAVANFFLLRGVAAQLRSRRDARTGDLSQSDQAPN
jgi:hypothetical protein